MLKCCILDHFLAYPPRIPSFCPFALLLEYTLHMFMHCRVVSQPRLQQIIQCLKILKDERELESFV